MGMLGKLIGAVIDTALVPVELAKDVVTLGGAMTEEDEPYTLTRLKRVVRKVDRAGADPSEWPEDLRVLEFPR